jgi:hypothetical protein
LAAVAEPTAVTDLGGDRVAEPPPDRGHGLQQADVALLDAQLPELALDASDLVFELVDQRDRGHDVGTPRVGEVQALDQLTARAPNTSLTGQARPKHINAQCTRCLS